MCLSHLFPQWSSSPSWGGGGWSETEGHLSSPLQGTRASFGKSMMCLCSSRALGRAGQVTEGGSGRRFGRVQPATLPPALQREEALPVKRSVSRESIWRGEGPCVSFVQTRRGRVYQRSSPPDSRIPGLSRALILECCRQSRSQAAMEADMDAPQR